MLHFSLCCVHTARLMDKDVQIAVERELKIRLFLLHRIALKISSFLQAMCNLNLLIFILLPILLLMPVYSADNSTPNTERLSSKANYPNPRLEGLTETGLKHEKGLTSDLWHDKIKVKDIADERVNRILKQKKRAEEELSEKESHLPYLKEKVRHTTASTNGQHSRARARSHYDYTIGHIKKQKQIIKDLNHDVKVHEKQGNLSQKDIEHIGGFQGGYNFYSSSDESSHGYSDRHLRSPRSRSRSPSL